MSVRIAAIFSIIMFTPAAPAQQQPDNRPLPDGAITQFELQPHSTAAPIVRYLNESRLFISGSIWDLAEVKVVAPIDTKAIPLVGPTPATFDDLQKLFVYHHEKGIAVRDLVTGVDRCFLDCERFKDRQGLSSVIPVLSPDGSRVIVPFQNQDEKAAVVRWFDSRTGKEQGQYRIDDGAPGAFYWQPKWYADDGAIFGYVTSKSQLKLIDSATAKHIRTVGIAAPPVPMNGMKTHLWPAWSYERVRFGKFIVAMRRSDVGPGCREFTLWDQATGGLIRRFQVKPGKGDDMFWYHVSPDGRSMGIRRGFHDNCKEIDFFETASGRRRGQLRFPVTLSSLDLSPDGKSMVTGCSDATVFIWDLNRPLSGKPDLEPPRSVEDADKLWKILGDPDPAAMDPVLWALVRAPNHALPLLKKKLQPVRGPGDQVLQTAIGRLDSADFRQREAAARELTALYEFAIPAMHAALGQRLSLEQKRRIEELLEKLEGPVIVPSCLRELRAVEVLERIGTAEACDIVETLATGNLDSLLTREARLVLSRWHRKK